jgi:hypothetical protein
MVPPQSMSVSVPSLVPSVHVGAGCTQAHVEQTSPDGQATSHAPQFIGSLTVLTHPVAHLTCPATHAPQTPPMQPPVQQSVSVVHAAPSARHVAWQVLPLQIAEQHSEGERHGAPSARHEGAWKSTPTVASPLRRMLSVTETGVLLTVASTGSLNHVGSDDVVTPLHAPAYASPVKRTVPVGSPFRFSTVFAPALTSAYRVVLVTPVAVTATQPTLPSSGTCVMATCAIPVASSPAPMHPAALAISPSPTPTGPRISHCFVVMSISS